MLKQCDGGAIHTDCALLLPAKQLKVWYSDGFAGPAPYFCSECWNIMDKLTADG